MDPDPVGGGILRLASRRIRLIFNIDGLNFWNIDLGHVQYRLPTNRWCANQRTDERVRIMATIASVRLRSYKDDHVKLIARWDILVNADKSYIKLRI